MTVARIPELEAEVARLDAGWAAANTLNIKLHGQVEYLRRSALDVLDESGPYITPSRGALERLGHAVRETE